ncbi:AAA family ATPase [Salibacterium aidingense]|uniref:AAA family ATPase n=1 Tax=Salibacterium aidingense TaxID=384933 RepID=UPI000429563E|nr:AAA family ATPase [Salibacterium aidingense]
MPIICIEGPPAAGKTTAALELEDRYGAYVVPETPFQQGESSWNQCVNQVERWRQALEKSGQYAVVVLDGDIFAPLVYASLWKDAVSLQQLNEHFQSVFLEQKIGLPDHYVYLYASPATRQKRMAGGRGVQREIPAETHHRYYTRFLQRIPTSMQEIRAGHEETAAREIMRKLSPIPEHRYEIQSFQCMQNILRQV